jgi:hypothetical protein
MHAGTLNSLRRCGGATNELAQNGVWRSRNCRLRCGPAAPSALLLRFNRVRGNHP